MARWDGATIRGGRPGPPIWGSLNDTSVLAKGIAILGGRDTRTQERIAVEERLPLLRRPSFASVLLGAAKRCVVRRCRGGVCALLLPGGGHFE